MSAHIKATLDLVANSAAEICAGSNVIPIIVASSLIESGAQVG